MKENNHNTCIVYLLNCIDKHIYSIEMFLACLKINMKHPKNIDVEPCRLRPVMSQCTKWLFPTAVMCVKTVSSNETFGYIGCQGKMSAQCYRVSGTQFPQCWHFVDIHLCQCNVMTLLNNLSGTGSWLPLLGLLLQGLIFLGQVTAIHLKIWHS